MASSQLIKKRKPDTAVQDFELLRLQGIDYLQTLAGDEWTDYNVHDPGMTLLEALCYAITDLGYRMGHPMEDLLAPRKGEARNPRNFYSARQILSCNPVTETDFRKLIVDVEGVKNAWLEITEEAEVNLYYSENRDALVYRTNSGSPEDFTYNGLYKGVLEFEEHDQHGDLNDNTYEIDIEIGVRSSPLRGFAIELYAEFAFWDNQEVDFENPAEVLETMGNIRLSHSASFEEYDIELSIDEEQQLSAFVIENRDGSTIRREDLERQLLRELNKQLFSVGDLDEGSLLERYQQKIAYIRAVIREVLQVLHEHRNLCEDFISFRSMKVEEVAFCLDIEVTSDARASDIQAQVYYLIDQFLSPAIPRYGLDELLMKGMRPEDIFDGPPLQSGFILTADIENSRQTRVVHGSDIINLIMDIEGVIAVRNVKMANFTPNTDGSYSKGNEAEWCLHLTTSTNNVPRLSIDRTRIIFYKESIPQVVNPEVAEQTFRALKATQNNVRKGPLKLDIDIPKGRNRNLAAYTSVQEHLPLTYGIGQAGLPPSSSNQRKAQAAQLKGYLLLFEQILANFHAQLDNIPQLFSMEDSSSRTYYTQPVYEVPRVAQLLVHFRVYMADYEQSNGVELKTNDQINQVWEAFQAEDDNAYRRRIDEIAEGFDGDGNSIFEIRRNQFLDHMVARFAEDFREYALLMHDINDDISNAELIEDKLAFLQHYPIISSQRGKGYNYKDQQEVWETSNVTGLQRRLSRLLGIDNPRRRGLAYSSFVYTDYVRIYQGRSNRMRYAVYNEADEVVVRNAEWLHSEEEAYAKFRRILIVGTDLDRYQRKKYKRGYFYFLLNEEGERIGRSPYYDTAEALEQAIKAAFEFFQDHYDRAEGMHVIEHILLRPHVPETDVLLPIDTAEDEQAPCPCIEDPYSFRVSILMPAWPIRFTDVDFRNYIERKIRLETPAHIFPKICWVNQDHMSLFEEAYRNWLLKRANIDFDMDVLLSDEAPDSLMTLIYNELLEVALAVDSDAEAPERDDLPGLMAFAERLKEEVEDISPRSAKGKSIEIQRLKVQIRRLCTQLDRLDRTLQLSEALAGLIDALKLMRSVYPVATLHDCDNSEGDNPVSLDNTVLGTFKTLDDER